VAQWADDRPVAAITFYRSLIEGGLTAPVDALIEALAAAASTRFPSSCRA
jgi:cobaltochelatase CobN